MTSRIQPLRFRVFDEIAEHAKQFVQKEADETKIDKYLNDQDNQKLVSDIKEALDKDGLKDMYGYFGAIRLIHNEKEAEHSDRFNKARGMPRALKQYFSTLLLEKFRKFAFKDDETDTDTPEVRLQKMQLRQYLARVGKSLITYVPHGIAMQYVRTLGDFKTPPFQTPYQIGESKPANVMDVINKLTILQNMNEKEQSAELARIAGMKNASDIERARIAAKDKQQDTIVKDEKQEVKKENLVEINQDETKLNTVFGENPTQYAWILVILRGMFAFNDGNEPMANIQPKNVPRDSCEYINALNASEGFDMALTQDTETPKWESYCDGVMPVCKVRRGKLYTESGYNKMLKKNNRSKFDKEWFLKHRPVKKPAKCSMLKGYEGYDAEILKILREIHRKQMKRENKRPYLRILYYEFAHRPKFSGKEEEVGLHAFRRAKTNYEKSKVKTVKELIDKAFQDEVQFVRGGKTANYLKLTGNPMSRLDLLEDFATSNPTPAGNTLTAETAPAAETAPPVSAQAPAAIPATNAAANSDPVKAVALAATNAVVKPFKTESTAEAVAAAIITIIADKKDYVEMEELKKLR